MRPSLCSHCGVPARVKQGDLASPFFPTHRVNPAENLPLGDFLVQFSLTARYPVAGDLLRMECSSECEDRGA